MNALLIALASFFGGWVLLFVLMFLFPEKAQQWGAILARIAEKLLRRGGKAAVAWDIQGRVNAFGKRLAKEAPEVAELGVKVEWIEGVDDSKTFMRSKRLVVRMRRADDQEKNFVHACMAVLTQGFLPKAKRYISPSQRDALDLFAARKLFEAERPRVIDSFFEEFYQRRALENETVMELLDQFSIVDKVGLFFPVLAQELCFLGQKVFYGRKNEQIVAEVGQFIDFLERYADRKVGDMEVPLEFEGRYCRTGITIIALRFKRELGNITPYVRRLGQLLQRGLEHLYFVGSGEPENRRFMEAIARAAEEEHGLEIHSVKEFRAKIRFGDQRREVSNYMILMRSSRIERHFDKEYELGASAVRVGAEAATAQATREEE